MAADPIRIAILWRGNAEARTAATLDDRRLEGLARALTDVGLPVEPVVYAEGTADEARRQLLDADG